MKFKEKLDTIRAPGTKQELHIVCIGCSAKAEERVLVETDAWQEIFLAFSNSSATASMVLHLHLVGPEMSTTFDYSPTCHIMRGTAKEFFRAHPALLSPTSLCVVVGLNCGFGNWENPLPKRYDLLLEWLGDLYFLTGTKMPLIFTCANDYADLDGESQIMQKLLGCRYLIAPMENPYGFASTFIAEDTNGESVNNYSRGNSFLYAVQGCELGRRRVLNLKAPHDAQVSACETLLIHL